MSWFSRFRKIAPEPADPRVDQAIEAVRHARAQKEELSKSLSDLKKKRERDALAREIDDFNAWWAR